MDGSIPQPLVEQLRDRLSAKRCATDLLHYGVLRMPASAHQSCPADVSLQQA
jgi:hypothetical protein